MKGLTKKQFNEVLRRLKTDESPDAICSRVGIQNSTIRAIRQAGTYEEYARRRAERNRRRSAERAIHPAAKPNATSTQKPRSRKSGHDHTSRVVDPQSSREPVSAFMLNEAYNEVKILAKALDDRTESINNIAHEALVTARKAHNAVASMQRAEVKTIVATKRPWWRFGR